VTIDTTRADAIGAYGNPAAHTPNLDAIAGQGALFTRAYATVPLTTPAHASMMSGLYPPRHGVHSNGDAVLPDEVQTLAEELKGAGYRTAGSVAAFVTTRIWNLHQGFDAFFDDVPPAQAGGRWGRERPADAVVDDLIGWLGEQPGDAPLFVWAHVYDPHHPHVAPKRWMERFPGDPYAAEVAFVDEQVGRLQDAAEDAAGAGGLAVIAVADHGEAFGSEHGEASHGLYLFESTMRIPFIARAATPQTSPEQSPIQKGGVRVDGQAVSNVDVMPTALGLLGLSAPEGLDGVDLSGWLRGTPPSRAPVFLESESVEQRFGYHPELAVVEGPHKLMATPSPRLFDVDADPAELTNIAEQEPERVARLGELAAQIHALPPIASSGEGPAPEVIEELAALGYITHDLHRDETPSTIDGKDRRGTILALEEARGLLGAGGTLAQVEAAYREILSEEPQLGEARMGLARNLSMQRRHADAEQVYREAIELEPGSTILRANLANCLAAQGRVEEALELMFTAHRQVPGDALYREGILRMLLDLGRGNEARELAEGWLTQTPDERGVQALLGLALLEKGEHTRARQLLTDSLEDGVRRPMVHRSLALIAAMGGGGHAETVLHHLERESAWFPQDLEIRRRLADVLVLAGRSEEAAAEYAFLAGMRPGDPAVSLGWAQAVFNTGDYLRAQELLGRALELAPDNPHVVLLQANVLSKLGQTDAALSTFERARTLKALYDSERPAETLSPLDAIRR